MLNQTQPKVKKQKKCLCQIKKQSLVRKDKINPITHLSHKTLLNSICYHQIIPMVKFQNQRRKFLIQQGTFYYFNNMSEYPCYSTDHLFFNNVGLADNISSSTLRHTSTQFSFPKSARFQTQMMLGEPANVDLPSSLNRKATSQGFGSRLIFQFKWQETQAKTLPSPDCYTVRKEPGEGQLKRSFGSTYECFQSTYLPYDKNLSPSASKQIPGPGSYQVRKELAQHKYKFLLKAKLKDAKDQGFPDPWAYTPKYKLASPSRFNSITQGIGKKKDPFQSTSTTPGPGMYTLPSKFDKFYKKLQTEIFKGRLCQQKNNLQDQSGK